MKRTIRIILALLLALALLPAALSEGVEAEREGEASAPNGYWSGDWYYEGSTVVSCRSSSAYLTVPDGVTAIGGYCFSKKTWIRQITLPSSVVAIGPSAFVECGTDGGFTVNLPSGISSIASNAFTRSGITEIDLPSGLTTIESATFKDCQRLTRVSIPSSVRVIEGRAFENCPSLACVNSEWWESGRATLYDAIEEIKYDAFAGCSSLSSLTIGSGVKRIATGAFRNCSGIGEVVIEGHGINADIDAFDGIWSDARFTVYCDCWDPIDILSFRSFPVHKLHFDAVEDPAVPPTCTETGLTAGTHCSRCGDAIVAQEIVPARGHKPVTDKAVPATYLRPGKTRGSHCRVCGEVLKAQREVPRLVARKVLLNKKKAALTVGKTLRLKATLKPEHPTSKKVKLTWTTSDKKVATVDKKGKVKAVGAGVAVITVETPNGKKATCRITVKAK